jgi:hypothetical protein
MFIAAEPNHGRSRWELWVLNAAGKNARPGERLDIYNMWAAARRGTHHLEVVEVAKMTRRHVRRPKKRRAAVHRNGNASPTLATGASA